MTETTNRPSPQGFTLVELLVIAIIIAVLVSLLLPGVQVARESARRTRCRNNLKQLALAIHNYRDAFGTLPAGIDSAPRENGVPLMWSWQMKLLPYIDQQNLYNLLNYNRGVIAPDNHVFWKANVATFHCPADESTQIVYEEKNGPFAGNWSVTNYLGVSGGNGLIVSSQDSLLSLNQCQQLGREFSVSTDNGSLYGDSAVRIQDFADGVSNTVMIGERVVPERGARGWWTGPGLAGGCPAGWTDVVMPGNDMLGLGGLKPAKGGALDAYHWSSPHQGGTHFSFADGSIRLIKYEINPEVFRSLTMLADGKAVEF